MFSETRAILVAVFSIVFLLGCGPKLTPLTPPAEVESPNRAGLMDLPVLQLEEQQKKPRPEKLYTLSVRNAGIRNVLLSFSRESKENIIVDPDVRGKVTVDLKDVTLPQALDALLTPLNLDYHMESGFIRVSKPKKITRLFHLNYIITSRTGSRGMSSNITENVGSGTSGTTGTTGTTGGTTGTTSGTRGSTTGLSNIQGSSVSGSEVQDIFQELELGLQALGLYSEGQLSGGIGGIGGGAIGTQRQSTTQRSNKEEEDYGIFSINRQAGIIIINSYPEILGKAAELIEAVEGTIQRQVLIQAKIVEVLLDDEFIYGIDWSLIFNLRGQKQGRSSYPKWEQRALVTDGLIDTALGTAGAFSQFTMSTGALNLVVKALEEQGEVNIISSPQISTLNNQTAIIRVATVETVFLGQSTTIAATATTTTEGATTSTVTIGVTLDVTPQISPT
ncbi:MAG: secretin and TonB N-terminal domain-containing protein, partial [Candidatus Brocadiales bacterium]